MENNATYVNILVNTLRRKEECLTKLKVVDEKQELLFAADDVMVEDFEELMEEKGSLITELENLDKGFETVYDRVKDELTGNKDSYKEEILTMQDCITRITELTVNLRANEERNKAKVEMLFAKKRAQVKNNRVGTQMASNYYKSMNAVHQGGQSYFLDTKN